MACVSAAVDALVLLSAYCIGKCHAQLLNSMLSSPRCDRRHLATGARAPATRREFHFGQDTDRRTRRCRVTNCFRCRRAASLVQVACCATQRTLECHSQRYATTALAAGSSVGGGHGYDTARIKLTARTKRFEAPSREPPANESADVDTGASFDSAVAALKSVARRCVSLPVASIDEDRGGDADVGTRVELCRLGVAVVGCVTCIVWSLSSSLGAVTDGTCRAVSASNELLELWSLAN